MHLGGGRILVPCNHCGRTGVCTTGDDQGNSCGLCLTDASTPTLFDRLWRMLGMQRRDYSSPGSNGEPTRVRCCVCRGRGVM